MDKRFFGEYLNNSDGLRDRNTGVHDGHSMSSSAGSSEQKERNAGTVLSTFLVAMSQTYRPR